MLRLSIVSELVISSLVIRNKTYVQNLYLLSCLVIIHKMNSVEQLRQTWSKVLAVPASEIEDDDSFFDCMFLLPY